MNMHMVFILSQPCGKLFSTFIWNFDMKLWYETLICNFYMKLWYETDMKLWYETFIWNFDMKLSYETLIWNFYMKLWYETLIWNFFMKLLRWASYQSSHKSCQSNRKSQGNDRVILEKIHFRFIPFDSGKFIE